MIKSTLTAGVLALSLVLTSLTPTTASATITDEDALAGLLALLFIGAVIHHSRDDDDDRDRRPRRERAQEWRTLPAHCNRTLTRRNGQQINFFPQRCLNRNYRHVDRLPERCFVRFQTNFGQPRQGYSTRCLRNEGFRINRH